jgi:hypothetical protein
MVGESNDDNTGWSWWDTAVTVCVALAVLVLVATAYFVHSAKKIDASDFTKLGPRGDFYAGYWGSAFSLFSGLLFLAALLKQSEELGLQRRELQKTQKIAEQQAEQMKNQAGHLQEQVAIAQAASIRQHVLGVTAELSARRASNMIHHKDGVLWGDRTNLSLLDYICKFIQESAGESLTEQDSKTWKMFFLLMGIPEFYHLHGQFFSGWDGANFSKAAISNVQKYPLAAKFVALTDGDATRRDHALRLVGLR